jgi:hypothetical protein
VGWLRGARLYGIHFLELSYKAGDIHSWFFVGSVAVTASGIFLRARPEESFSVRIAGRCIFLKALLTKVGGAFFVSADFGNYEVRGKNCDGLSWCAVFGKFALAANGRRQWHHGYSDSLTLAALRFIGIRMVFV